MITPLIKTFQSTSKNFCTNTSDHVEHQLATHFLSSSACFWLFPIEGDCACAKNDGRFVCGECDIAWVLLTWLCGLGVCAWELGSDEACIFFGNFSTNFDTILKIDITPSIEFEPTGTNTQQLIYFVHVSSENKVKFSKVSLWCGSHPNLSIPKSAKLTIF